MNILLIQPPHYYPPNQTRKPDSFPLGLGYILNPLLKFGHQVDVLDIWAYQLSNDEVIEKVKKFNYDVIGISALSTQYAYVKWLSKQIKEYKKAKIVIGNALATLSPRIVLENTEADIYIIGEGEITFKEVVEGIGDLGKVKGIYFKEDGRIIQNPPREYIQDLDSIDFPRRDLFPVDIYLKECRIWEAPQIKATNIISGRGCPYRCRFCSKTFTGVRLRSVGNIIEEIRQLKERYGIRGIAFNDELFVINKNRIYELCSKIKDLNLKWMCQGRVNIVDLDLLKYMKKSGCLAIGYGIESGSQAILDNMNKNTDVIQAKKTLKDTIKAGIMPILQMMYGYPGETKETLEETVHFFREIPYLGYISLLVASNLSPTTALPGTEIYNQARDRGLIVNENEYLENLSSGYMFNGTRPLVNFTSFTEDKFYQIRIHTQRRIFSAHTQKHFFKFSKEYLIRSFKPAFRYVQEYGLIFTLRKVVKTSLALCTMIFSNKEASVK